MRNPFMDKHKNPIGQQKLFDIQEVKQIKHSTIVIDESPINVEDYKIEYCLTSKGMDPKSTNMTTRNRKIIELIKSGKTSANTLAPHFNIPIKTIMVELRFLKKEGLINEFQ